MNNPGSITRLKKEFAGYQKKALNQALTKLRQMGLIDSKNNPIHNGVTPERCADILEGYYYVYLEREKKAPMPKKITEFVGIR